jgi:beta-lactamase regulating signal transducer with metallopeptidase domain
MGIHVLLPLRSETHWLAWLLTYFAHASLWAAAAGLIARKRALAATSQNQLWRVALLGPIATTALAALGPLSAGPAHAALSARGVTLIRAALAAPWAARESVAAHALCALFVAASALGLLRFTRSLQLLGRALSSRTLVSDAQLHARLERLRARTRVARVRLSESPRVPGPLIVGRSEICIPSGGLAAYSDDEMDAIFAHELAHLERRDGLWFPVVGLVEAVLWMQPLNHWLAARYRHSAELACDDRALQLTAAPMALARALTRMTELTLQAHTRMLLPTMASARLERVKRLVAAPAAPAQRKLGAAWLGLLALGAISPWLSVDAVRALPAPPDAAAYTAQMSALEDQARALEDQLAGATNTTDVLELEQALRHVRETQAWHEHAYAGALDAWERDPLQ